MESSVSDIFFTLGLSFLFSFPCLFFMYLSKKLSDSCHCVLHLLCVCISCLFAFPAILTGGLVYFFTFRDIETRSKTDAHQISYSLLFERIDSETNLRLLKEKLSGLKYKISSADYDIDNIKSENEKLRARLKSIHDEV